jgi:uncharacterized RDD family membrane protein YckC
MTDPTGGAPNPEAPIPPAPAAPPPQAPAPPAAAPQAAVPPAPAPAAGGNWQTPPPAGQPQADFQVPAQFQPVAAEAGPAPGVLYADLVTRIIAYVIDGFLLAIVTWFAIIALGAIFLGTLLGGNIVIVLVVGVVLAIASMAISAAYFIYFWTRPDMRASLGQKVMGIQTVNAADGATLTRPQAARRWAFLYGIFAVASALQLGLAGTDLGLLGSLLSLLTIGYWLYLLWTTSQNAKRQGFHDLQAATVVVKPVK